MDAAALSNKRAVESLFRQLNKAVEGGTRTVADIAEALGVGIEEAFGLIRGDEDLTLSDLELLLTACELKVTFDVTPVVAQHVAVYDWQPTPSPAGDGLWISDTAARASA